MKRTNESEIKGKMRRAKGSIKEGAGRLIGDTDLESRGRAERAAGRVQESMGKTRRKAGEAIEKIGKKIKR